MKGLGDAACGVHACLGRAGLDFAECLFVALYVFSKGVQEVLGVFGGHDDASLYAGLGHVGGHGDEVAEEFAAAVGDHGEVAVVAFCYFGAEFYFYFLLFLAHNCLLFMVYSLGFWFIVDG